MLRVQLLGPVRAWRGDEELELGGPRPRAVFGMLAMHAHRAVSRSELIDGVWDAGPPASAVNSVHVYISGLRRVRFRGQVMLALYRCGRPADALAAFTDARRLLAEQLGIDPGPALRRLHQQILTTDVALDPPDAAFGPPDAALGPLPDSRVRPVLA